MVAEVATIYVVDDDASIRKSLTRFFSAAGYQVEAFDSAVEFLDTVAIDDDPACMVLDLNMPGIDGLDLQAELGRREIAIPIVFLTGHGDIPQSVRAIKAGAVDFVTKPFELEKLLKIIERALEDDREPQLQRRRLRETRSRYETLTPREREVFELVVAGMLNKQIAAQLGAAEKTIKVHRGRVMEKMEAQSVADLVRMAERLGIPEG